MRRARTGGTIAAEDGRPLDVNVGAVRRRTADRIDEQARLEPECARQRDRLRRSGRQARHPRVTHQLEVRRSAKAVADDDSARADGIENGLEFGYRGSGPRRQHGEGGMLRRIFGAEHRRIHHCDAT